MAQAVWAPSVHNTQPWRFTADGRQISLYADLDRGLPVADPDGREMMISCGAALFNVRLALTSLGYIPQTRVLPDPGQPTLVAQVSWPQRTPADELEQRLFSHVLTRRTHRGAFDPEPLPPGTLDALRAGAVREGAALRIVADDGRRAALAAAVETAERHQRLVGERVRELARWAPAPGSGRSDGVPGDADEPRVLWQELTRSECFELLANEHLGRLAVVDDRGPVVFPVNFVLDRHTVVFRTEEGTKLHAASRGSRVCFEVDGIDAAAHTGWSVIVRGEVTEVTDLAELARLRELPLRAWAPGARNRHVRILPAVLTGRRIAAAR